MMMRGVMSRLFRHSGEAKKYGDTHEEDLHET